MPLAELVALAALALCLLGAAVRPWAIAEVAFAAPLAGLLIITGIEPWHDAVSSMHGLLSTLIFLALILAFGHLCAQVGVFDYLGSLAARSSGGQPTRLLVVVVALAAVVTAVLTLDATVVLLTPVVLRTVRQLRVPARPHLYACAELANAGSLLLPVSNLTNLLAFTASGLSFGRFTLLMAVPWLIASVAEWAGLRLFFRRDLAVLSTEPAPALPVPRYGLGVLALTVLGFVVTSGIGIAPAWAAAAGVLLLGAPLLLRRQTTPIRLLREAGLGFIAFVFALGVIVDAVTRHGLGSLLQRILPSGESLGALLAIAFLAALAANLVNNLPATLALTPIVAGHPLAVLAVLLGVNIGPNLTYIGSLATLLWRRLLPAENTPRAWDFHLYGALSVPAILAACTGALWLVG